MINGKSVLAVIPARGGSKGVPKKNIRLLNEKPLIAYTIEEAIKSKYLDKVVISTDSKEIADICKKYGGEIPYLRPKELARDDSPTVDCVLHMIEWLKNNEFYEPDYICLLQCTSPLRTFQDIDGTIEKIIDSNMDGAISVCEAEVNPYWTNVFDGNSLRYFIEEGKQIRQRQKLPKIYRYNGAVYVIKTDIFIKEMTFEPKKITGYIMSNENSIDIDTEVDFKIAEIFVRERDIK